MGIGIWSVRFNGIFKFPIFTELFFANPPAFTPAAPSTTLAVDAAAKGSVINLIFFKINIVHRNFNNNNDNNNDNNNNYYYNYNYNKNNNNYNNNNNNIMIIIIIITFTRIKIIIANKQ